MPKRLGNQQLHSGCSFR